MKKSAVSFCLLALCFMLIVVSVRGGIFWPDWVGASVIAFAVYGCMGIVAGAFSDLGKLLRVRPMSSVVPVAVFMFVLSILLLTIQSQWLHIYWLTGEDVFPSYENRIYLVYSLITTVVVAPIVEEIFFRRWLFQLFNKKLSVAMSVVLVAVIFSAGHSDPFGAFVFSIVLSLIWLRQGNLVQCIWIHVTNNALAVFFAVLEDYKLLPSLEYDVVPAISGHPVLLILGIVVSSLFLTYAVSRLLAKSNQSSVLPALGVELKN